jgi:hypothetical protein
MVRLIVRVGLSIWVSGDGVLKFRESSLCLVVSVVAGFLV